MPYLQQLGCLIIIIAVLYQFLHIPEMPINTQALLNTTPW